MRSLIADQRALSETIGALLLVLIVVSASASFAVFVQSKQDEVQERELAESARASERVEILALAPELDTATGDAWKSLNFTLVNYDTDRVKLAGLAVNGQPLKAYTLWRWSEVLLEWQEESMQGSWELNLTGRERVFLNVTVATDFHGAVTFGIDDYVKLDMLSGRLKAYGRAFLPPTAIGLVEVTERWNAATADLEPVILLDGRQSDHPDPAARIIRWSWLINETGPETRTYTGRYVKTDFTADTTYTVKLTVTDSFGMLAVDEFTYTV